MNSLLKKIFAENGVKIVIGGVTMLSNFLVSWQEKKSMNLAIKQELDSRKLEERIAALEAMFKKES